MTRLRLSIAALLCLVSTSAWADLRSYDVDFQYRNEVYEALRILLANPANTATTGSVQLLPSGQILVNATPQTLEQVDQLLRAIRTRPAAATPRVSLRYWAVLGTPPGTAVTAKPGSPRPPSALQEVLTELKRFHGELQFQIIGTAAVVSESGQSGEVQGIPLEVEQMAHVQGDTLNAHVVLKLSPPLVPSAEIRNEVGEVTFPGDAVGEIAVRTSLKRGEFVVLGESTQQGNGLDGTIFYIVHWPE
jgi:hypothetical protein